MDMGVQAVTVIVNTFEIGCNDTYYDLLSTTATTSEGPKTEVV